MTHITVLRPLHSNYSHKLGHVEYLIPSGNIIVLR